MVTFKYDSSYNMLGMPEKYLVFTGRPNAGKSSIIRRVVGLDVTTGKRPGTTRRISKYPLADGLFLVDMPGFGKMMGVSKAVGERVQDKIVEFLESNAKNIVLVVHVLDISTFTEVSQRLERKGIIPVDVEMVQFLAEIAGEFPLVAANKIDKAARREIEANLEELKHRLSAGKPHTVEGYIYPVSARTGEGLGALKSAIHERLVQKGFKTPFKPR